MSLGEAGVCVLVVTAHTDDARAGSRQLRRRVAKHAGLSGTYGGEVFRVEIEHDGGLLQELVEAHSLAVLVRPRKIRCVVADGKHGLPNAAVRLRCQWGQGARASLDSYKTGDVGQ